MAQVALIVLWCGMCSLFLVIAFDYRNIGLWAYHVVPNKGAGPDLFRVIFGVAGALGLAIMGVDLATR